MGELESVKKFLKIAWPFLVLFAACLAFHSYDKAKRSAWNRIKDPETVQALKRFIAAKKALAQADTNGVPPEIQGMYKYAERGDWLALSNSVHDAYERNMYLASLGYGARHWHGYRGAVEDFVSDSAELIGCHWEPKPSPHEEGIMEVYGALDAFMTGDEKYSAALARDIIASIPPGSVYLGGSLYFGSPDPGLSVVEAVYRPAANGDPLFAFVQYGLCGEGYLEYARRMYGKAIYIPTNADLEKCHQDFLDASHARILSGSSSNEFINRLQAISGSLTELMSDKNPHREFFVEQSYYPNEWMDSQLEPHGLIFKLNRQPVAKLSDEIVQRDQAYWAKYIQPMIGNWLNENTSIAEIAAFAEKTYGRRDYSEFKGDPRFIENAYSQKVFSTLRSAIARLYEWRASHATNPSDKERMLREADFAYRQAWAIGPDLPSASVGLYINFLVNQSRVNDAVLVAETALSIVRDRGEHNQLLEDMVKSLKEKQSQSPAVR
jgi:hypothetical protein